MCTQPHAMLDSVLVDCYRLFEIDFRLADPVVRESVRAGSIRACAEACDTSRAFICRSFSFVRGPASRRSCDLSSLDPRDPGFVDVIARDIGAKIYERRSYEECLRGDNTNSPSTSGDARETSLTPSLILFLHSYKKALMFLLLLDYSNRSSISSASAFWR